MLFVTIVGFSIICNPSSFVTMYLLLVKTEMDILRFTTILADVRIFWRENVRGRLPITSLAKL